MKNKIKKFFLCVVCMVLMCNNMQLSYASIGASDGKGYVSKAEFNKVLSNINERLSYFEEGVKIEETVDAYLSANYYQISEFDTLLMNKQNNILNIPGSAGQVLKRNAANDGLEFGDVGEYYEKPEMDALLANKQNNILDITGSANQYLKRNASNNSLEFGDIDIGDCYEKTEVDTLLANKQNSVLNITGSANQYLRRNSSNNALEFASLPNMDLYLHLIMFDVENNGRNVVRCKIINNDSTAFTLASFESYLYSNGFTSNQKMYMCTGHSRTTTGSNPFVGVYSTANNNVKCYMAIETTTFIPDSIQNFTDIVIPI